MEKKTRRQFIKTAMLATGGIFGGVTFGLSAEEGRKTFSGAELVPLGKTNIKVSRLGFGTGTVGYNKHSHQTRLGQEEFTKVVHHAYDRAIRFFDAADQYGSHPFLVRAMKERIPREKVVINTKIWVNASKEEGVKGALDRFRSELETEYIDIVLLHCVMDYDWPQRLRKWMDGLDEAKERKIIRAHGVSCHSFGALKAAATTPWVDYIQARINHVGKRMDAAPKVVVPVLKQAHAAGKGIGGMKILGEGELKDERQESIRFVLALGCVDTLIIGFQSSEEIDDIAEKMAGILRQEKE